MRAFARSATRQSRRTSSPVKVQKVIDIFQEFEQSLQFWGHAVASGMIDNPKEFINPVQHISFVHGQDQVDFPEVALHRHVRAPLLRVDGILHRPRQDRRVGATAHRRPRPGTPIAATKMDGGTDINFGNVSRKLLGWLAKQARLRRHGGTSGRGSREGGEGWKVTAATRNRKTGRGTVQR